MLRKETLAEGIGTFLLVFFGTGAIVINSLYDGVIGHLGIAITFGLVVTAVIYALGEISGAHLNPAVTWAFFLAKRITASKAVSYTIAQLLGAIFASWVLKLIFPMTEILGQTLPSGGIMPAIILEIILSFALMFVIINVATGSKEQGVAAGLAIGFTVLICALIGGPISGASMNPARSIGPAVLALNFEHLWLYCIAPVVGTFLSILAWWGIRSK